MNESSGRPFAMPEARLRVPLTRFLIGFLGTLLVSLTWSVPLLALTWGCDVAGGDHGWRWLRHHMTYGLMHHIVFPFAVGLLFSIMRRELWKEASSILKLVLVALLALIAWVTWDDARKGRDQPYEMADTCSWLESEMELRAYPCPRPCIEPEPGKPKPPEVCLEPGEEWVPTAAHRAFNEGRSGRSIGEANIVGKTAVIQTWLFLSFCALLLWYAVAESVYGYSSNSMRVRLGVVLALMTPWIPARVYASWYQTAYLCEAPDHKTAILAGIFVAAIFLYLIYTAWVNSNIKFERVVYFVGVIITLTGFLLTQFPNWLEVLGRFGENMTVPLAALFVFVVAFLGTAATWLALSQHD